MEKKDLAEVYARFFIDTTYERLPQKVIEATKHQILDYIGVAIAGANIPGAPHVRELYTNFGGAEQALVWGSGKKLPVVAAAQCNATAGHCLDFDDVHEDAIMHPGVISIPTSFALADYMGGMTGKELITAVALAGDMISRMNLGLHPGKPLIPFGWHTTTLNGSMVSANLTSKLLGLSLEQTIYAIGLGYHQTCGNGQTTKDGGFAKRLGPGFAVRNGITSALLAQLEVTAAINSMEGEWGFYNVYHGGDYIREQIIEDLGERWESLNISIKPYPCCRGTHNFIDAGIILRNDHKIDPEEIERIDVECGAGTLPLLGQPLEVKAYPKTVPDAQFSCAWGIASGLAVGQATLKEYSDTDEGIHNPKIRAVAAKIKSLEYSEEMDVGKYEAARVTVTMKDGQVHSIFLPKAKGCPDEPLTFEDVVAKYNGNLSFAEKPISSKNGEQILKLIEDLESVDDVRKISKLIVWE